MYKPSYVVVCVESLNHGKILAALVGKNVEIKSAKREYKRLTITIKQDDEKVVTDYLSEICYGYRIIARKGVVPLGERFLFRKGLMIGGMLAIVMLVLCFCTVFSYNISGAEKTDEEVRRVLDTHKLNTPMFKKAVNTDEIKEEINHIEGVALCSVYLRGCMLFVEVNEELEKQDRTEHNYLPVVAEYDCIITNIVVLRGTSVVSVGETVKKGQVLIAPYYCINKEDNITIECEAIGEVTGRTFYTDEKLFYENKTVCLRTGKIEKTKELYLSEKELSEKEKSNFDLFEEEISQINLDILPICIRSVTRFELIVQNVYIPFETVKKDFVEDMYLKICDGIKNNVQIVNKWCIIENRTDAIFVKSIVEAVQSVGIKRSG